MKLTVKKANKEEENEKWSKPQALYIEKSETDYKCKDCAFWRNNKCALYDKSVTISPDGTCGLWVQRNDKEENNDWIGGLTKAETGYEENKEGFSCKRCEYFNGKNACEKVESTISKDGCCNHWERK